jgi:hypothetical protein
MSTELVKACVGSPTRVAAAAKMLHDVGIPLLVEPIVGLPGDTPEIPPT